MNNAARVFTSRYRAGVVFAPGPGCLMAPILFVPGLTLLKSVLLAAAFALGVFALATYWWTERRKREPALVLSRAGMRLEGLPPTPWREIGAVRRAADMLGRPALEVELRGRAPRVLRSPLWRPAGLNSIVIHASLLEDPLETIEGAFGYFIAQS